MGSAALHLNTIIIGGGLGGLSAAICLAQKGHKVRVLERNEGLSEFGAGIQISPNGTRILDTWGLRAAFEKLVHVPAASIARRYRTGAVIGLNPQNPEAEETYGYPYWQIYRPDFQKLLAEGAVDSGAQIEYGKQVSQLDAEAGIVTLVDGTVISADLVICADGIRSRTRPSILGNEEAAPVPFEEYNYRAMIPWQRMMEDSETAQLMASRDTQAWLGPGRAIVGYPISNGKFFNLAMSIPRASDAPIAGWNQPGDIEEFRSTFSDFCPLVQKLVKLVDECAKWTIAELPRLKTWSSQSGRTILLGDAAHAMSPHAAQGGAMAIEDAAVLGECLSTLNTIRELPAAANAYQAIRRPRVARIQEIARDNGTLWVLPDGPEQECRDRRLLDAMGRYDQVLKEVGREGMRAKPKPLPDAHGTWPEQAVLMWLYGYDAIKEVSLTH